MSLGNLANWNHRLPWLYEYAGGYQLRRSQFSPKFWAIYQGSSRLTGFIYPTPEVAVRAVAARTGATP